jgi:UDP-GlcNAc:undecaprenyl-phosphate GlcNAc-1-phosphate transferase
VALIIAFVVALAVTPLSAMVATRLGIVDRPGPLKVHERPIPYFGGVAVFIALACALSTERPSVLLPLALAALIGAADDVTQLSPRVRLVGEVVTGVVAAVVVPVRGPVGGIATIVLVVALCNAVNLLDGLDGLAAGVSAASALGFAFGFSLDGVWSATALALVGALAGFVVWNWAPARVYLGDAGSYLVGTALAVLLSSAWGPGRPVALGAAACLFVFVPVLDTAIAIVRRARARRPLLSGDRGHVYDQLVGRGWPVRTVVLACIAAQLSCSLVGVGLAQLPAAPAIVAVAAVAAVVAIVAVRLFTDPRRWTD